MSRLTINPADVIDYKTPLYKEDREAKKVYRLLPETTADQVQYAGGQNGEAVKAALESGITAAQSAADAAQATANSASASAAQAGQTADEVKAQVDNPTTGLAATKTIADNALAAAVVMQGATANSDGEKGLAPQPVAGNQNKYLRGDGTWQTPPDTNTTYSDATQSAAGLMSKDDKIKLDGIQAGAQVNPTLPTVNSLFPSANNNPGYLAVFDGYYVNAGYLSIAAAKTLFATDLSSCVKKTGSTMTDSLYFNGVVYPIAGLVSDVDLTVNPSSNKLYTLGQLYNTTNGGALCQPRYFYNTAGAAQFELFVGNYVKTGTNVGQSVGVSLGVMIDNAGTAHAYAPTPPSWWNGNIVATLLSINEKLGSGTNLASLAALDETDPDYVETFEIKKQKAIAQINAEAQQAIYGGFPYEINGDEYFIDYSLFDQQNLASRAIIAEQNPNKIMSLPCRNESGDKVWLDVSTDIVLAVHKYGLLSHTDAILKAADAKKAQIMAAETEAEIHAIIME